MADTMIKVSLVQDREDLKIVFGIEQLKPSQKMNN
jgi:hypothetical protein